MTLARFVEPAWEKLRRKDRNCFEIAAFFRNNQVDGFSLSLREQPSDPGYLNSVLELIDNVSLYWASLRPQPSELIQKLSSIGGKRPLGLIDPIDHAQMLNAISMIAYLEEIGALESDDFNGIIVFYRKGDTIEIERFDA